MSPVAARICATCDTPWPIAYKNCPICLRDNIYKSTSGAITEAEARSLAAHANFKRAYARYDMGLDSPCGKWKGETRKEMRRRGAQSPEELGRMEAEEQAPSIHAKHKTVKELEKAYRGPSADK